MDNVALGNATASDNCGSTSPAYPVVTKFVSYGSGQQAAADLTTVYPRGATTVTWVATDVQGNVSTDTQIVTVVDNVAPTIVTAPASPILLNTDAPVVGTPTTYACYATAGPSLGSITVSDNCSGTSVAITAPLGVQGASVAVTSATQFPKGTTLVTWTVSDTLNATANVSVFTQTVTVTDNELPRITAPSAVTVSTDAAASTAVSGVCYATNVSLGSATVADNCANVGTPTATVVVNNVATPVGPSTQFA
jgi:hypothetical protein